MALTNIIKATYSADDRDAAHAIACIFNADRIMRLALAGPSGTGDYTDEDILRLGEIIQAYAPKGLPRVASAPPIGRVTQEEARSRASADAIAEELGVTVHRAAE